MIDYTLEGGERGGEETSQNIRSSNAQFGAGVHGSEGSGWQTRESGEDACAGDAPAFCAGTSLVQADPFAGAINLITVSIKLKSSLPPQSRITLTGLLPSFTPVLFAVTTSKQCAEQLPYGPTDSLLPVPGEGGEGNPMLANAEPGYDPSYLNAVPKTGFQSASGFASTFNGNSMHLGFLQRLYDNDVLKFEILWSFLSGPKSLRQRFEEAAGNDPRTEPVVWTIRDANKTEIAVKRGIWSFSGKWAQSSKRFDAYEDNTAESSPESKGFSPDDGVWGAATGLSDECSVDALGHQRNGNLKCGRVDGAISPHEDNPIIQPGGDFWGHGNFNQLVDHGCEAGSLGIEPCCSTYFMGGHHTAKVSENIRNEMFFIPCPSCHCSDKMKVSKDGTLTGSGAAGDASQADNTCKFFQRKVDNPPLPVLLQSCGVIPPDEGWWDNPDPWYVSFGDTMGNPVPGHSDWTVVLRSSTDIVNHNYTFTIRNPQQVSDTPAASSEIVADAPAGQSAAGLPFFKSFPYEQSAAYTVPPDMKLKVIRQTNEKPGELNNITMRFRPSSKVLPNSRLIVDGLLEPAVLFARTTEVTCAGGGVEGLPFLPDPIPDDGDIAWVSWKNGNNNRTSHTSWTQELHADGELRFSITWMFSKTRTLNERLEVMASPGGEGVTWYIFSPAGKLLQTKIGSWETPSRSLWPISVKQPYRQEWGIDALWGAANGPVGGVEGSAGGAFALPNDFWGQGWIDENFNVWCELYWMEGVPYKAKKNIRNEIHLEMTPMVSVAVGNFTPHRMPGGRIVFVLQELMDTVDDTELTITTVNGFDSRNSRLPYVGVAGCAEIPSQPLKLSMIDESLDATEWPIPTLFEQPLFVTGPRIKYVRIYQDNYFPSALNVLSIALETNIALGADYNTVIEISNLLGALAPTGAISLRNTAVGSDHYILFSSKIGGPPGEGHWDDDAKTLTLYLVGYTARDTLLSFGVQVENPSVAQSAPVLTLKITQGIMISAVVTSDISNNAIDKLLEALVVSQSYFTDSTEMRQSSDNPGKANRISLVLSANADLRATSRSYSEFVITFSNLRGAVYPSGAVPLQSPLVLVDASSGATQVGAVDSASYFKAGPANSNAPGYGLWDNEHKVLKLWLVRDLTLTTKLVTGGRMTTKTLGLSFVVDNSPLPQLAPNITIKTSGATILFSTVASSPPCWPQGGGPYHALPISTPMAPGGFCLMRTYKTPPPLGVGGPLAILTPTFKVARIGQSTPYPGADNILTVTLELNVELVAPVSYALPDAGEFSVGDPVGISIVFAGLEGASAPHFVKWLPAMSPFGQDAECLTARYGSADIRKIKCNEMQGPQRSYFKSVGKWNNASKTLEIFVKNQTPRSALVFSFPVVNRNSGQSSPNVTVRTSGVVVKETLLVKDSQTNLAVTKGIYNGKPGDAHPLLVFAPNFEVKNIGQTTPYPGARNSLIITLAFNVDVRAACDYHDAVYLNMSGFAGGESVNKPLMYTDPSGGSSRLVLGAQPMNETYFHTGMVYWNGLHGYKRYWAKLMRDVNAAQPFIVQFDFDNPATPQDSPDVKIESYGMAIAKQPMHHDMLTQLAHIYESQSGWAAPLYIRQPRFVLKDIGQTNPYPGQDNTIRVTLSWNVDLFARVRRCYQRAFKGWVRGERGFDESQSLEITHAQVLPVIAVNDRDTQKAGGGRSKSYSKVCSQAQDTNFPIAQVAGTPCTTDMDCFGDAASERPQNSFCVETLCHADEFVRPYMTIENLAGCVQPSGTIALRDFLGNQSTAIFAGMDTDTANEAEWSRTQETVLMNLVNTTCAGRLYTLEFTLQNPLAAQNSPDVRLRLDRGSSISVEAMRKDVTRILPVVGAEAGHAAPLKVYAIKFTYARIGQASSSAFSSNTITVTLASNLELQKGSMVRISPFAGSSMTGIDDFNAQTQRISLTGHNASMFYGSEDENCAFFVPVLSRQTGLYSVCASLQTAHFDAATKTLTVYNVEAMEAESQLSFEFKVRNPGVAQVSPPLAIAIAIKSAEGTWEDFPSAAIVRDVGDKAPLKVYGATFRTKRIGQSVPYPSALNEIGVTLSFNIPIPSAARPRVIISGLRGALPYGTSPDPLDASQFPLRSASPMPQCTGMMRHQGWLGCGAFGIVTGNRTVGCSASWIQASSDLAIDIINDLDAETDYAFTFTIRNPPKAQSAAVPRVELQGNVPILPKISMDRDATVNLQDLGPSVTDCNVCEQALPYWHLWAGARVREVDSSLVAASVGLFPLTQAGSLGMPLKIIKPNFLDVRDGAVRECGPGETCGGLIWQTDPDPGSPHNVIKIRVGVSAPLLAAAGTSIHVKGLRNAVKQEGIHDLAASVREEDIFLKKDSAGGEKFKRCRPAALGVSGAMGGRNNTWKWVQADQSAVFHLTTDLFPGVWYYFEIGITNPLVPQNSPADPTANPMLWIEVRTANRVSDLLENRMATPSLISGQYPVLQIEGPSFVVKDIGQLTALPSAVNRIVVTMATNVPLREGTCVKLSGFSDGQNLQAMTTKQVRLGVTAGDELWTQIAPTPGDVVASTRLGEGQWDGNTLQVCLVQATLECTSVPCLGLSQLKFSIEVINPGQAQESKEIRIQSTQRVSIAVADMNPDSRELGTRKPLRILRMRFIVSTIGQSSRFPGASNTITVTMSLLLPLLIEMKPEFTLSGLRGSRTSASELDLSCTKDCTKDCTSMACSISTPLLGGCCGEVGQPYNGAPPITGDLCTLQGRPCISIANKCDETPSEESECCNPSLFASIAANGALGTTGKVRWNAGSGTLSMRAIQNLDAIRNYSFSIVLENPIAQQAAPAVLISASAGGSQLIAPVSITSDAAYPPLQVDTPRFLLAAAKQSTAFPCQRNTITVTLALNVPVRKGLRIELQGLDGAQLATPEGKVWSDLDILDTPNTALSSIDVRGIDTQTSEILGLKLNKMSGGKIWLQVQGEGLADGDDLIKAGSPFAFSYAVFNPRVGQAAPITFKAEVLNARVGTTAPMTLINLPPVSITGCHAVTSPNTPIEGSAVALFVFAPQFNTLRVAQSSSAPRAGNVLTVTFSCNVPLSARCQVALTLTGLTAVSGDLHTLTQPGTLGTKWRSDSCPASARDIITLEPARQAPPLSQLSLAVVTNVTLYGATPRDTPAAGRISQKSACC